MSLHLLFLLLSLSLGCNDWDTFDGDGDGSPRAEDCDDDDPRVFPGADEVCDGHDNDCDGLVDDDDPDTPESSKVTWFADADRDGFGADRADSVEACVDPGGFPARREGDCDDGDAHVAPDQPEVCDGVDNDCDPDSTEEELISVGSTVYEDLQEAIDASDGETVFLCPGVYEGNFLVRQKGVHLVGLEGPELTILDGQEDGSVLQIFGPTTVEGLTLRGGLHEADGGGIDGVGAPELVLRGLVLKDNSAFNGGGLAGPLAGTLVVEDCSFEDNTAVQGGGAAVFDSATLSGNRFVGNSATVLGGGIYIVTTKKSVALTGNLYSANLAERGAAWWFSGETLSTSGEQAELGVASDCGGAGFLAVGQWQDSGSTFTDNSTVNHGGAAYLEVGSGAATFTGSVFSGNVAGLTGGAVSAWEAPALEDGVVLDGAELSGNSAINGGALYLQARDASLLGSALWGNTATGQGGAVWAETATLLGDAELLLSGNEALTGGGAALTDSTWTGGGTVQGNTATTGGGLWLDAEDIPVLVEDLQLLENMAPSGAGVTATGGSVTIRGSSLGSNVGVEGGALLATGGSAVAVQGCTQAGDEATLGAGAQVDAGSALSSIGSAWEGPIHMQGSGLDYSPSGGDFSCSDSDPWICE